MTKLFIVFISLFIISNCAYGQESNIEVNPLNNLVKSDSLEAHLMNKFVSEIIKNAEKQIQGAGAKEKKETYITFIKTQLRELCQKYSATEIAQTFNKHFTPDEIKELTTFFETPAGKNMLGKMTKQIGSVFFSNIEEARNYTLEIDGKDKQDVSVFYATPTGNKLSQKMNHIISELMSSLSINFIPDFGKKLKKELARLDSKIWREAYKVKPEQVIVHKGEFTDNKKVIRIKNNTETMESYVTFAVPIFENKFWIRFDKSTEIVDKKTDEHYLALRLDNDFVLNKTMIVSDQKMKMIEITMVFPLLKKSVKRFDIIQSVSEDADLMSNNTAAWSKNTLVDISLKEYLVKM